MYSFSSHIKRFPDLAWRLGSWLACLLLMSFLSSGVILAQEKVKLNYNVAGQAIEGSVKVIGFLDLGTDASMPKQIQKGSSITVPEVGKAKVTLTFQELEWTSPDGFDGKMDIKVGDIFSSNSTVLGDQDKPVRMGVGRSRRASLNILGAGTTVIKVAFRIDAEGLDNKIIAELDFPLTVRAGGSSPTKDPKREMEEAWQTARKVGTIEAYQKYLQDFPDGPMVSVAKRKIATLQDTRETPTETEKRPIPPTNTPKEDPAIAAFAAAKRAKSVSALEG
ncbi:MAG: hypothetical protein AAFV07_18355, partial [Bacteroidota bacterium]